MATNDKSESNSRNLQLNVKVRIFGPNENPDSSSLFSENTTPSSQSYYADISSESPFSERSSNYADISSESPFSERSSNYGDNSPLISEDVLTESLFGSGNAEKKIKYLTVPDPSNDQNVLDAEKKFLATIEEDDEEQLLEFDQQADSSDSSSLHFADSSAESDNEIKTIEDNKEQENGDGVLGQTQDEN
ncbi:uncharacterized protein LOC130668298 [Microplitis mediator]|uniref:uncharacterized protein LOC130668298 n=1 Tax=Microplitis mediator TaxID=375433 RepID=UPI002553C86C|nr:uncharacterized protein LOC130668298 [Microplitis mediator]